jgi:daunorubicin resistance ABC transporter ATP-binding subunit
VSRGEPVIVVEGIRKAFGSTIALQGVDLVVEPGTVQALLGRNGAGKSTLVRILSTLLAPDAGHARIGGADLMREPGRVRASIGLAGQSAAVDGTLTGRENLELVGRLYGLGAREAQARAVEVVERLSLTAAADRRVFTYSGGMRRRLDLGASLVGHPRVLIMDEPTTGLDPATRLELWRLVEEFAREGTTVLLTTQYLEEADRLANQIAVIERGRIIASGTSSELKDRLGQDVVEVRARNGIDLERVRGMLVGLGSGEPVVDERWQKVTLPTTDPVSTLLSAGDRIEHSGIQVEDLGWRRPTLDDVFLTLTTGGDSGGGGDGAGTTPSPSAGDDQPAGQAPRRGPRRRGLSYLAVAALVAALAVAFVLITRGSPQPPRAVALAPGRTATTPGAGASHAPQRPAATPETVTSLAGITQGRTVALGATAGGLTADASGNIWASLPARGAVARVATATGKTQTFPVGGHPRALAAAPDRVWVAGSALAALASLNLLTGQPLSTTTLRTAPTAISVDPADDSGCTVDSRGTLTHIDSTGVVLGTGHVSPAAVGVGCGEGWVWAVRPAPPGLVRMGDYGGTRQFDGGPSPQAVTFDVGVWIANRDGTVTVFNPQLNSLRVNRQVTVAPELDGIAAAEDSASVWAISRQTKTLYRISNTAQPSLTGTVVFTSAPVALVVSGRSVWVATLDGALTQIRY